ncbi:MAG TPA: succinate dehydrogenase cytochrome b subunit [Kofleriaceae bacterium]|nr:succinate dehydrogenase cytochrome b subunit [Kofleriaceae bacterium]
MSWFIAYVRSSIGAKTIMAVTGLLMVLFAIVHMVGHLQMFGGQDMYNAYAHFLQSLWEVKWPVRAGLLGVFVVHIASALRLVWLNKQARPVAYKVYRPKSANLAGRTMAWTGIVILAFIVFHLVHFTFGLVGHEHYVLRDPLDHPDVYSNFVYSFQNPIVYATYFVAILLLSIHLSHGASAWLQSLGLRHPKYPWTDKIGPVLTWTLFVGYMLPPTACLLNIIKLPGA